MTGSPSSDPLAKYREKRDFAKTAEPEGRIAKAGGNRFVVQKHAASRLHYDLRLELDGVLKSWAVTRGPSINPDDKRLAVRTEDHPVEYATFEGTIPKSKYGGGTMMLWDTGTWEPLAGKDPSKTLPEGHLHFFLHGHRLKGEWMLFRLKPRGKEKGENWILRKVTDDQVGGSEDLVGTHLTGVVSGLTMEQIASGERGKSRAPATPSAKPATKAAKARATGGKKAGSPPPFQPVQLATLVDHVPARNAWLHEMKYDGYRTLVAVGGGTGHAYTRSGLDWTDKFAGIVADAADLDASSALIDGEAVVVDANGKPTFRRCRLR